MLFLGLVQNSCDFTKVLIISWSMPFAQVSKTHANIDFRESGDFWKSNEKKK
jgi:hypothetical protein